MICQPNHAAYLRIFSHIFKKFPPIQIITQCIKTIPLTRALEINYTIEYQYRNTLLRWGVRSDLKTTGDLRDKSMIIIPLVILHQALRTDRNQHYTRTYKVRND